MTATGHLVDRLRILRDDPRVEAVSVFPAGSASWSAVIVLPDEAWLRSQVADATNLSRRALRSWQTTYDLAYRKPDAAPRPGFASWTSSFTREQIPQPDMEDWLAGTVRRLRALGHGRVLEIGCGTGLIVEALAPFSEAYRATDLSGVAIGQLRGWLDTRADLAHVETVHAAAHEVGQDWPADLVVLNSVVQYFPDAAYLSQVLDNAWRCLRPGGHIFVGDVRLLGALPCFVSAVELARSADTDDVATLWRSIHAAWLSQSELVIDPGFFHDFAADRHASVSTRLKSGHSASEMTRYRYDVVIGKPGEDEVAFTSAAPTEVETMAALRSWLVSPGAGPVVLRGIANKRVLSDVIAHQAIGEAAAGLTVATLRQSIAARETIAGDFADPADLEEMAAARQLHCAMLAPPGAIDGRYDAWFGRSAYRGDPEVLDGWAAAVSQPLLFQVLRRFGADLLDGLSRVLPAGSLPTSVLPVARASRLNPPLYEIFNFSL